MCNFTADVKYLCALLYPNSSKEDFCKIPFSSDEVVFMAAISTLKGGLLPIFEWFLAYFAIIYIITRELPGVALVNRKI